MTFDEACRAVGEDWKELAQAILDEDAYADHVTEEEKQAAYNRMAEEAERVSKGAVTSFTMRQRVEIKMTGVCRPLLP